MSTGNFKMLKKNFEILKSIRENKKMTIAELSRLSGVSTGQISTYENGKGDISSERFFSICRILEVDLSLFSDVGRHNAEDDDLDRRILDQTRGLTEDQKRTVEDLISDYKLVQELKRERAEKNAA